MSLKMASPLITILLVSVSIVLAQCKTTDRQTSRRSFDQVVMDKLGKDHIVEYNASKNYALCYQRNDVDHSQRVYQYIVVSTSDNRIIRQGTYRMGYVKWAGDDAIEVLTVSDFRTEGVKEIIKLNDNRN